MQGQQNESKCSTFENKNDCKAWQRTQNCQKDCPYLEGNSPKELPPQAPQDRRKHARAFQRMLTRLQIAKNNNAYMRFMTVTSAREQKRPIKKSFAVLRLRIERATYKRDGFVGFKFNRYFCLRTSEGNGVLHIVFWGRFIPQDWLSKNWLDIHGAFRADIRACFTKKRRVDGLVGYLLTNYLTEQPIERMSYGWKWAWLGFCKSWEHVKRTYSWLRSAGRGEFGAKPNFGFHHVYHNESVDAWHCVLWDHPQTTCQARLRGSNSLPWLDVCLREVGKIKSVWRKVKNPFPKPKFTIQTCFNILWFTNLAGERYRVIEPGLIYFRPKSL
jgi:hypothetical protein